MFQSLCSRSGFIFVPFICHSLVSAVMRYDHSCWVFSSFAASLWVQVGSKPTGNSGSSVSERQPWEWKNCLLIPLLPLHSQDCGTPLGYKWTSQWAVIVFYNAGFPTTDDFTVGHSCWLLTSLCFCAARVKNVTTVGSSLKASPMCCVEFSQPLCLKFSTFISS